MNNRLDFIPEREGHILITEAPPTLCNWCFKPLSLPFMYCKKFQQGFCRKCELETPKRLCDSKAIEHSHFKIIEVKGGHKENGTSTNKSTTS
jgi:hypothetical protein